MKKFTDIKEKIEEEKYKDNATLDDAIDEALKEETSGVQSVKELFRIKEDRFTKKSDIDLKTELDDNQIINVAVVEFITELNGVDLTKKLIVGSITDKLKRLMVSRKRQGRTEAVDIFKAEIGATANENNFFKKMFTPKQ